ncbi:MAG: hypothetical protein SFZ03_09870 [Candidatus Melainabacteria bacterium]|nr:hypothetical protein [Candidatus Melainabacteria bacterium]
MERIEPLRPFKYIALVAGAWNVDSPVLTDIVAMHADPQIRNTLRSLLLADPELTPRASRTTLQLEPA